MDTVKTGSLRSRSKPRPRGDGTVHDQLKRWRDDLINLSRNNRLLYFRAPTPSSASTVEITAPDPVSVLERLDEGGRRGWEFYLPPAEGEVAEPGSSDGQLVTNNVGRHPRPRPG